MSKTLTTSRASQAPKPATGTVGRMVAEARDLAADAERHVKAGCTAALKAGLRMMVLHQETNSPGARNDLVSRGTRLEGFESACEQVGVARRTAYRWMTAVARALFVAEVVGDPREALEDCPEPDSPQWREWERTLEERAEGTSLRRLLLGHVGSRTDMHRLEELTDAAERGSEQADQALAAVDDGKLSLGRAMAGLAGGEATKGKERRDPVYIDIDAEDGRLDGLFVRSLKTLRNAFREWPTLPEPAKAEARKLWKETVSTLPADLR